MQNDTTPSVTSEEVTNTEADTKLSQDKIMSALRKMVDSEQITHEQMVDMRRKLGISNASFHKKKIDLAKKKKARRLAKAQRQVNRHNGSTKGQKMTGGR
jgi:hypothetical protein